MRHSCIRRLRHVPEHLAAVVSVAQSIFIPDDVELALRAGAGHAPQVRGVRTSVDKPGQRLDRVEDHDIGLASLAPVNGRRAQIHFPPIFHSLQHRLVDLENLVAIGGDAQVAPGQLEAAAYFQPGAGFRLQVGVGNARVVLGGVVEESIDLRVVGRPKPRTTWP